MTNKEFAFNYAGKEFTLYGIRVILVGYNRECPGTVIVSPPESRTEGCFWQGDCLEFSDAVIYKTDIDAYQYAQIKELEPVPEEKPCTPLTRGEVKPKTPGECIAYYEGQQGMNYSVVTGCVSAVYKRQGGALKLVSKGDSINNVTEKI